MSIDPAGNQAIASLTPSSARSAARLVAEACGEHTYTTIIRGLFSDCRPLDDRTAAMLAHEFGGSSINLGHVWGMPENAKRGVLARRSKRSRRAELAKRRTENISSILFRGRRRFQHAFA
ncbi:hypothetical protein ABH945_004411 [Paraburkholderia sp. GAS333]